MMSWRALAATMLLVGAIVWAAACGGGGNETTETFGHDSGVDSTSGQHPDSGRGPTDGGTLSDTSLFNNPDVSLTLSITPANPTVDVTIQNGVITANAPVAFQALEGSNPINPTWSIDRGEIGAIDAQAGQFTASGSIAGVATITAQYGSEMATTTVTVHIHATQNGAPPLPDGGAIDAGAGGVGGVGGEGNGGAVGDAGIVGRLQSQGTPPTNNDYYQLYPYDKTVWPQGLLAPLIQFQTSYVATDIYIHLTEANYEFEGFYSVAGLPSPEYMRQPIDQTAWQQATYSNGGEPLQVDVKFYSQAEDTVYGPMSESWTIASGVLRGTVYYNSYNSTLTGSANGAVLAIKPGATSPNIAVPGTETTCFVCHSVSSDGTTLFAQDNTAPGGDYANGRSYNLKTGAETRYIGIQDGGAAGTASDGTPDNRKFAWSGVYPDGTFAMASARYTREAWQNNSAIFAQADGTAINAGGFSGITSATTPAFSDDGRHLAFDFWDGNDAGVNGVYPGGGHTLDIMDFDCNAGDGGIACGAQPWGFNNLRELYRDATNTRWIGWPAFLPDGKSVVFQNTVTPGLGGPCASTNPPVPNPATNGNCMLSTWAGAQAEIWSVNVPASGASSPVAAANLNGVANGASYLPTSANHPNDEILNYQPTANPIASGGYYWVVFTSRRMYGNVAAGDPYDSGNGTYPIPKKLWVAAIDINQTPGQDPSHPAFYLPGQELNAGNMRGYWVVDPCAANGMSCETGDQCCGGFCRAAGDGGALVCSAQTSGCSMIYEKCTTDGDCCAAGSGVQCINGFCSQQTPK